MWLDRYGEIHGAPPKDVMNRNSASLHHFKYYPADSLASEHLCEDAAGAPDVHRCGVSGLQQNLGGTVPQCHHLADTNMEANCRYYFPVIHKVNVGQQNAMLGTDCQ